MTSRLVSGRPGDYRPRTCRKFSRGEPGRVRDLTGGSAELAVAAGALLLAGAAQLITISALVTPDYPLAATWSSLLLAIAPAPVVAVAAFAPDPVNLLAAVLGVVILVAGIAGGILHLGVLFVPALVVLAGGAVKLRREHLRSR